MTAVGFYWVTLAFVVAWASDIVAFLVGSAVGGPKLWPRYSPNKTWSGFIGGLVAGTVAGAAMAALPEAGIRSVEWSALLGLAAALATMAGDLWESALKRRFGVKDAGNLIPGHGGLHGSGGRADVRHRRSSRSAGPSGTISAAARDPPSRHRAGLDGIGRLLHAGPDGSGRDGGDGGVRGRGPDRRRRISNDWPNRRAAGDPRWP